MSPYLYIATSAGLFIAAQTDGEWRLQKHALIDTPLTSVAVSGNTVLAGTENGIRRSPDQGGSWREADADLDIRHIRWLAASRKISEFFLAGTEPAGIFVSSDDGGSWRDHPEVAVLRKTHGWFLPYSRNAGCVRGFAIAESRTPLPRIYAAVEVGGLLVSEDGGNAWHLVEGSDGKPDLERDFGEMIHPDVHSVTVHPSSADLVTAPTGGGLYRSFDGGKSWKRLYRCYIRAVWVDPKDPEHLIAGPAEGVSRNGRIEESTDGGDTWRDASQGMKTPWKNDMVVRFFQKDDILLAVLTNGELWMRPLNESTWTRFPLDLPEVKAVAANR
ncbi:MAG: WD40/YVTN/BNR-like repeat-containing protein [Thermodesulfobacteriota bacterium]